jgi:hypothetical protein
LADVAADAFDPPFVEAGQFGINALLNNLIVPFLIHGFVPTAAASTAKDGGDDEE